MSRTGRLAGLALVFVVGCSPVKASTSAALAIGTDEEDRNRAAAGAYLWHKRGALFGDIAHAYCVSGSAIERRLMLDAASQTSPPARVTIACPE